MSARNYRTPSRRQRSGIYDPSLPSLFDEEDLDALSRQDDTLKAMRQDADEWQATRRLMMMSMGSGSDGNCYYIGTYEEGILIDAGVEPLQTLANLRQCGISPSAIRAIFVTHDHTDHVRYLYPMLRRLHAGNVRVYCTPRTLRGMLERHRMPRRLSDYHVPIYKEFETRIGAHMGITAFDVSHDASETVGYHITFGPWHTLTLVTDTGYVTPRADHYLRLARHAIIESNYDPHMLSVGPYPEYLKERIQSQRGHLSNADAASFIASMPHPPRHVWLCHLSADNNTPGHALKTMVDALDAAGHPSAPYDESHSLSGETPVTRVSPLPRTSPSPLYILNAPVSDQNQ